MRRSTGPPLYFGVIVVIVAQDAMGVALGIIELALAQHPPERGQTDTTETKADRDEDTEDFHQRSLRALSDTVRDEVDIASAAIRGEHRPATASGTASRL